MTRYSFQLSDRILVKNMGKNSHKRLDHAKKSGTDALKTSAKNHSKNSRSN